MLQLQTNQSWQKWIVATVATLLCMFSSVSFSTPSSQVHAFHTPSAYAVFRVSYSTATGDVRGGVAGTAFFTSRSQAVSAHHVINAASFQPNPGHDRVHVWLVHEGREAIEIDANQVKSEVDRDFVKMNFGKRVVQYQEVFSKAFSRASETGGVSKPSAGQINSIQLTGKVFTEGFRAGTAGPVLEWRGGRVVITSVPRLERLRLQGEILRSARVELKSTDVNLKDAPAFQTSYSAIVGTSGGPITNREGKVIGFNSFADPEARTAWGVSIEL